MCHKSQIGDPEAVTQRVVAGAWRSACAAGLPEGATAEIFRVTRIP